MILLLVAVALLIVYGSLFPFDFDPGGAHPAAVQALLSSWTAPSSRGDILGNVVLFLPFGLIGQLALPPAGSKAVRFLLLLVLGFVLAAGVQVLQLYFPTRNPVLVDVTWNMAGLVIGAAPAFSTRFRDLILGQRFGDERLAPFVLLACWFGSLLVPFVPSIDLQLWKDSLKPLLLQPEFVASDFIRDLPAWLAAACLGRMIVGERLLPLKFAAVVGATFALKVVIVKNVLTLTDVAAGGGAVLLVGLLSRSLLRHPGTVAAMLLLGNVFAGLVPFEVRPDDPAFLWVPFQGSLTGSMFTNASVIAFKVYYFGALAWLLIQRRLGTVLVGLVAVSAALAVELGQLAVGTGTPEITDPLLALAAVAVIRALRPGAARRPGIAPTRPAPAAAPRPAAAPVHPQAMAAPFAGPRLWQRAAMFVGGCVAIAAAMHVALGLPGVPYNVRELFGGDGGLLNLLLFAAAALSIGLAAALAGSLSAASRFPYLILPAVVIPFCYVIFKLLDESVSDESLYDVVGVASAAKPGEAATGSFVGGLVIGVLGRGTIAAELEYAIRFVALAGSLVLLAAVVCAAYSSAGQGRAARGGGIAGALLKRFAVYFLCALPWLVLFKFIVVDDAVTDNLTELIGDFGILLYALILLLAVNAVAIGFGLRRRSPRTRAGVAALVVVSLPVGWLLLQHGLRPDVEKYGIVFSGAQFLLGANRTQLVPEWMLMLRWFAVQLLAVAGLAYGMRIGFIGSSPGTARPPVAGRRPAVAAAAAMPAPQPAPPPPPPQPAPAPTPPPALPPAVEPAGPASPGVAERQVRLPQEHVAFLEELSGQMGTSLSEAVQMVLDSVQAGGAGWHARGAGLGTEGSDTVNLPIRFREDQVELLNHLSLASGMSVSSLARLAVGRFIRDLEDSGTEGM